jgi:hypothetical protein
MIEEDANDPNAVWIERAEHELEVIYNSYIANVERVAKEMRDWVLVPWLKANNYEFKTGNGTWSVYDVAEIARLMAHGATANLAYGCKTIVKRKLEMAEANNEQNT